MPTSTCVEVIDGDTLRTDGERIRLEWVHAPEKGQPDWQKAKSDLEQLVLNKIIRYEGQARDKWGRLIAQVWVDNLNVNQKMKDLGYG